MRGSQFQEKSVHEAIRQNNEYKRHLQELKTISELQGYFLPDTTSQMAQMQTVLNRARNFEEAEKLKQVEKDNLRLLNRFLSI